MISPEMKVKLSSRIRTARKTKAMPIHERVVDALAKNRCAGVLGIFLSPCQSPPCGIEHDSQASEETENDEEGSWYPDGDLEPICQTLCHAGEQTTLLGSGQLDVRLRLWRLACGFVLFHALIERWPFRHHNRGPP